MTVDTESEKPGAHSQKHAEPEELEDRYARTPLLDIEKAQGKMNQAIISYEDNICVHDEPITTDFAMETMSILNPKFKTIPQDVKKVLFHLLGDAVENLTLALSAGMQFGLINKTIAKGVFWPEVASSMGVIEPAFLTQEFGTRSPMKLSDDKRRNKTAYELEALVHQFKESANTIILSRASREAQSTLHYFLDQYKHRFDETLDDKDWSEFINFDLIGSLQSKGIPASQIRRECYRKLDEYRDIFDDLSDYCVVWARPLAIHNCRVQLRALFDGHSNSSYITLMIPLWNIPIRIQHVDVPPVTPPRESETKETTKSDKDSRVSNKKPRENKPRESKPFQRASNAITTNTPAKKPKVMLSTTTTNTSKQSTPTQGQPVRRGEPYVPQTTVKQTTYTTEQIKAMAAITCKYDSVGCYNTHCMYGHQTTYTLPCKYTPCLAPGKCKLTHDPGQQKTPTKPQIRRYERRKSQKQAQQSVASDDDEEEGEEDEDSDDPNDPLHNFPIPHKVRPTNHDTIITQLTNALRTVNLQEVRGRRSKRSRHTADIEGEPLPARKRQGHMPRDHTSPEPLESLRVSNVAVNVLHDCPISYEENLVLSLGLNFVPRSRKSKREIFTDASDKFIRQVRIKKHFASSTTSDSNLTIETILHTRINKSLTLQEQQAKFEPTITRSPIEQYLDVVKNKLWLESLKEHTERKHETYKWAKFLRIANQLRRREDIIIKPSDKNLGVTVMNKKWYIDTALSNKYLGDDTTYKPCTTPPILDNITNDLRSIFNRQTWLTTITADKLLKDLLSDETHGKIKLCRMYFMPKLHKPTIALRPICASIGWITYWASVYIHHTVFPFLKRIPSYVTNSSQVVTMLNTLKPPLHFQFVEADVENLYPSIDIDDGVAAIHNFLTRRTNMAKGHISLITNLLTWVLKNNYVCFGTLTFLQISGTAMGTPCAVVLACIYVHVLEQEALDIFRSTRRIHQDILWYVRFIDDVGAVVTDYDTGIELMRLLNTRRPKIKFTFRIRNTACQFLDLTIQKTFARHGTEQNLSVTAYSKPMNKFLFLPPTSCHPPHIFQGWITGYGRRLRLNCANDDDYQVNLSQFKCRLEARGYDGYTIHRAFGNIPDRQTILDTVEQQQRTEQTVNTRTQTIGVPFIITYCPAVKDALPAIKEALNLDEVARLDPHFPQLFGNRSTPLISFKRSTNLREIVAPSSLK